MRSRRRFMLAAFALLLAAGFVIAYALRAATPPAAPAPPVVPAAATPIGPPSPLALGVASPPTEPLPFAGIAYRRLTLPGPVVAHVLDIDLTTPGLSLHVAAGNVAVTPGPPGPPGPFPLRLDTVRAIAAREHFAVAVNASFFATAPDPAHRYKVGQPALATNPLRIPGVIDQPAGHAASLAVFRDRSARIDTFAKLPQDAIYIVSGNTQTIRDGQIIAPPSAPAPVTMAALDRSNTRLLLLVVDGRRPDYSVGMGYREAAALMLSLGGWNAINLDGGGSSTMVATDGPLPRLLNRPSDGHQFSANVSIERPVATVIGVRHRPQ